MNNIEIKKFKTGLQCWLNTELGNASYELVDTGDHAIILQLGDIKAEDLDGANRSFDSFKDALTEYFWQLKMNKTYETIIPNWYDDLDNGDLTIMLGNEL